MTNVPNEPVGRVEGALRAMGLELPPPPKAIAKYVGAVRSGNLVFVSGHGPMRDGRPAFKGQVGRDLNVEAARQAARLVILNALASLRAEIGDLDRVVRIVKLLGMVNCTEDFEQQPVVIDGASELLIEAFGDAGRHARSAVGLASLPGGIPVEIEMIVEVG